MSIQRWSAQRDQNEPEIVELFRKAGWKVEHSTTWDLTCLAPCGTVVLVEVKQPRGRLTNTQRKLLDEGWPLHVVRTTQEAAALVAAFR